MKFSWGELLVILIIIGMTAALLWPARQGSGSSPSIHCANKKKQLCVALHSYHDTYQTLPPAYTTDAEGKPLHSWRVLVLPYLEQESIFRQIRLDEPWDSEYNRQFHDQMPTAIFACPVVTRTKGETTYQVLTGTGTYFPGAECRSLDDDALDRKNTVLLVESRNPVCWMAPADLPIEALEDDATPILSHHARHPNVVMADGTAVDFSRLEIGAKHKRPE